MEPSEQIRVIFDGIEAWANHGSKDSVNKAATKLASGYANSIRGGYEADGSDMVALRPSTLQGPVRRGSDPTIRSHHGAVPMNASGALANSIRATRTSPIEWEIAGNDRGDMILKSNAKSSHTGYPFAGDTPKAIRDPLQVSDKQMDVIENILVEDLEKVLASI